MPPRRPSQTPALSLRPGTSTEPHRSWITSWWWSASHWVALLCIYFSAALLPLNTCTARCSRLWKAGRQAGGSAHRCAGSGDGALCPGTPRRAPCPRPPLQHKPRMGFVFLSASGLLAQRDVLHSVDYFGLLVKEGCDVSWNAAPIFALSFLLQMSLFN